MIVCVDGIRNYMTKFVNDDWMLDMGFQKDALISINKWIDPNPNFELICTLNLPTLLKINQDVTVKEAFELMREKNMKYAVMVDSDDIFVGTIVMDLIVERLMKLVIKKTDKVKRLVTKNSKVLNELQSITDLKETFTTQKYVIISKKNGSYSLCLPEHVVGTEMHN